MSGETDELTDIFLDVAGEETITERQQETPSHEIREGDEPGVNLDDGLEDAVDGNVDGVGIG